MPGTLQFDMAAVKRLLEHSKAAPTRRASYEDLFNPAYHKGGKVLMKDGWPDPDNLDPAKIPAGVWLVKDRGVYLMSNGSPGLLIPGAEDHDVVYAQGHDPSQGDTWDVDRDVMGGDDSVITLTEPFFSRIPADRKVVKIRVTAKHLEAK